MSKVPYILFDKQDGKDKTIHVTVASKKLQALYENVWEYVDITSEEVHRNVESRLKKFLI